MLRRLFLYLIGVGLGVILSIFFFGYRDIEFSYLPNARTLKHLRGQSFQFSEMALCQLDCINMSQSSFEQIFYDTDLDVDCGGREVSANYCRYFIECMGLKFSKFNIDYWDITSTLLNIDVTGCKCL